MKSTVRYYLFLLLGGITLVLGFIGVFLPILPTTPFLLVSSYCFIRSSKKAHAWLMNHPVLGTYLNNYIEHKAIRKKDRSIAIVFLWVMLAISALVTDMGHLKLLLLIVGFGVSIHLMMLRVID